MHGVEVCCVLSSVMINFDEIYPYSGGTTCEVKIHSEMFATRALWTSMLKGHGRYIILVVVQVPFVVFPIIIPVFK